MLFFSELLLVNIYILQPIRQQQWLIFVPRFHSCRWILVVGSRQSNGNGV